MRPCRCCGCVRRGGRRGRACRESPTAAAAWRGVVASQPKAPHTAPPNRLPPSPELSTGLPQPPPSLSVPPLPALQGQQYAHVADGLGSALPWGPTAGAGPRRLRLFLQLQVGLSASLSLQLPVVGTQPCPCGCVPIQPKLGAAVASSGLWLPAGSSCCAHGLMAEPSSQQHQAAPRHICGFAALTMRAAPSHGAAATWRPT